MIEPRPTHAPGPFQGLGSAFLFGLRLRFRGLRFPLTLMLAVGLGAFLGHMTVAESSGWMRNTEEARITAFWGLWDGNLIQLLLPLCALAFVTSGYAREVQDRTLVYHLVRPVRRWTFFLARYLAGVVPGVLVASAMLISLAAASGLDLPPEVWKAIPCLAIFGILGYGALYYTLAALFKRGMIAGLVYTFVIDGMLSSARGSTPKLSLGHHLRAISRDFTGEPFSETSFQVREAIDGGFTGDQLEQVQNSSDMGQALETLTALQESVTYASAFEAMLLLAVLATAFLAFGAWRITVRDYPLKD